MSDAVPVGIGTWASASNQTAAAEPDSHVEVQLLSITDFHGYLQAADLGGHDVVTDHTGREVVVGGVAFLATHLRRLRAGHRNSILFAAGDSFSGWPFEVDAHGDEPTIEALNLLGVQFSTLGNHELDEPFPQFLIDHVENGGATSRPDCDRSFADSTGRRFGGADFRFYSANVVYRDSRETILPPYNVVWVDAGRDRKIPVGFIHLTASGTTTGSTSYQPELDEIDPLAAANACAALLKERGVRALVLSVHDGGHLHANPDGSIRPVGPCFDLARRVSSDVAAIVTGHSHETFNLMLPDPDGRLRPVVQAGCHGQLINEIQLTLDAATGEVVRSLTRAINHPNSRDVEPDEELQRVVDYWVVEGRRRYETVVARRIGDFTRAANELGESGLGDLAADALYWLANQDGRSADLAVVAADPRRGATALHCDGLSGGRDSAGPDGPQTVLFGDAWCAFGYGNPVLTVTVTGAQVHAALEGQWSSESERPAPLAVSANVHYDVDLSAPPGRRLVPGSVTIDGRPLRAGGRYRLAGLCYTLLGEDGTTAFTGFTDPVRNGGDHAGFVRYLQAHPLISPPTLNRVRRVDLTIPMGDS